MGRLDVIVVRLTVTLITINMEHDMTQTTALKPYRSLDDAHGNNELLDMLLAKGPKNDAALARALEVAPPVISKIRHGRPPVGASLLIRMHEVFDVSIGELTFGVNGDEMRVLRDGVGKTMVFLRGASNVEIARAGLAAVREFNKTGVLRV